MTNTTANIDIIEITDELAHAAKLLASTLSEAQIRKRGMIDILGINCALNYFQSQRVKMSTKRSVHRIPALFEEFKITDIYYGNYRIDVITVYREKTIKIPKIHLDCDIMPHFYFVVQIGSKIREAKMIGFIDAKAVLGCSCDSKYCYPTVDLLFDLNKFLSMTKRSTPTKTLLGKHIDCIGLFLKFMDNNLSNTYKSQMIRHLMNCDSCRAKFIDATEFEKLAKNIRFYPNLVNKYEDKKSPLIATRVETGEFEQAVEDLDFEPQSIMNQKPKHIERTRNNPPQIPQTDALDRNQTSKKVIDNIFKEMRKIEMPPIKTLISTKSKHSIIMIAIILVVFIGFSLISLKGIGKIKAENNDIQDLKNVQNLQNMPALYADEDYPIHEAQLIPKERSIDEFIIKQPISTRPVYTPSVDKVAWEVPESLAKKQDYTKFLQLTGKNIKLNLQNELLLVNDVPINKLITVNIKISATGDVVSVKLLQTSGAPMVDNAVTKVVSDTLKYLKPPSSGILTKAVDASLTIELK